MKILFQKLFSRIFGSFTRKSKEAAEIADDESLSRFVFSSRHFTGNRIKHQAFLPDSRSELSIARIKDLSSKEIWTLGDDIGADRGKPALARGDFTGEQAKATGLPVVPDKPPSRHVNIKPWPVEKSEQKLIAEKLARDAKGAVRSNAAPEPA